MQESYESPKDKIRNFNIERDALSGIIKYPESLYEFDGFLSEQDFFSSVWAKVYSVLRYLIIDKQIKRLDSAIILATISNMGYKFPPECNISDSINKLIRNSNDIEYSTVKTLARDVRLYSIRREVWECGSAIQKKMIVGNNFGNIQEIIGIADEVYFEAIGNFTVEEDMQSLGNGIGKMAHDAANSAVEYTGFSSGFKYFDNLIGHLQPDSFNFVSARAKLGKSMFALNVGAHVNLIEKLPVFYADSELDIIRQRRRLLAHLSGVDEKLIRTGQWSRNPETCQKVEKAILIAEKVNIQYYSIRSQNVAGMISACRRFLFKNVKRNPAKPDTWNPCLFIWDYIKLDYYNDKNMGNNWWLDIAKSVVHFKDFLGKTQTTALVLGQQNSGGVAKMDKDKKMVNVDNETTVAGTDEIAKTASNVSQIRYKTVDEIKRDGPENGNCLLMPFLARDGEGGAWVQLSEGIFERDYVCFERTAAQMTFKEISTNKILRQKQSIGGALQ